jgi:hypothetical protein
MSESSSILFTNTDDIERVNIFIASNSVSNLRSLLIKIQRRILILENRIVELTANEKIIKATIYANADQSHLDSKYIAGINTQVQPVQSFAFSTTSVDPDHSLNSNKFNVYSKIPGVVALDAEINRINKDINSAMTLLKTYRRNQTLIQATLTTAQQKQSQNIFNKIGKAISPSPQDLAKDQIAKSRISNILLLQSLALTYNNFSTDPETQQRAYPDEIKLPETLLKIRQVFWATASQFHDSFVQSSTSMISSNINFIDPNSPDKLDFDDPGNPSNIEIITNKLQLYRAAGTNDKLSLDEDQFIKDNVVITNASVASKGIERKPDPFLITTNSLRTQTASYPAVAVSLGDQYIGSFKIPSINAAVKKWWKKKNATFSPLPICPNIPPPSPTITDSRETDARITQQAIIAQGVASYNKALQEEVAQQQELNSVRISDLPPNSPTWVITFTSNYGDKESGSIIFSGDSRIVTRSVNKNRQDAITNAQNVSYSPTPLIVVNTSKPQPISQIATAVGEFDYQQEVNKMYVAFILWELKP